MSRIKIILLFYVLLVFSYVSAQQLPIYQHSFLIRSAYNPATILNNENEISLYALRGNQFQKFDGGFVNNYASFNTPLDNMNIGMGLEMASRTYGPINQLSIGFGYAYRVKFTKTSSLIFGLRLGFMEHKFNKAMIDPYHDDDPIVQAIPNGHIMPNGNFGLAFQSKIGIFELAIPQLLSNRFLNSTITGNQSIALLPHVFTRYSIDFKVQEDLVKLTPIVSMRYLPGTLPQFEAGLTAKFINSLFLNVNYRSNYSIALGAGMKVNNKWTLGYSFDRPIKNRFAFNASNHEVILGYTFKKGKSNQPDIEWNQAEIPNKVLMDSVSDIVDETIAEEYLKKKLKQQKSIDTVLSENASVTPSSGANYKSIVLEINLADSIFNETNKPNNGFKPSEAKVNKNDNLTQTNIDQKLKQIEEEKYLEQINKNNPNQIKIVRNEQPSEKYFVELSGEDCTSGYYLITGVFSTLERAQTFRWKNDSEMAKIIFNKKNNYFYVVHSYSDSKSVQELENILKEYKSKKQKIWILDY